MNVISFPEVNVVFAQSQPQYKPLPAHVGYDKETTVTCCWRLTWRERFAVLFGGVIWHQILTFAAPLQPQLLNVCKPSFYRSSSIVTTTTEANK